MGLLLGVSVPPSSPPCVLGHLLSDSDPSLNPGRSHPESLKSGCKGPLPNEAIFAGTKGEDTDTSFEGPGAEDDTADKRSPVVERRAEVSTAPGAQPQRKVHTRAPLPVHRASGQTTAAPRPPLSPAASAGSLTPEAVSAALRGVRGRGEPSA